MYSSEEVKLVKQEIEKLMNFFGGGYSVSVNIGTDENGEEFLKANVNCDDPKLIIGKNGSTLQYLQNLLRQIISKRIGAEDRPVRFYFDVNEYRAQREEHLVKLARQLEREIVASGEEIVLKPLCANDRRIIHTELAESDHVTTESIGEPPLKQIVIKLKS